MIRACLFVTLLCAQVLHAGTRVALVVGNEHYRGDSIPVAIKDALGMEERLKSMQFDVVRCLDCDRDKIRGSIKEFGRKIKAGGEVVVYYSGHGAQLGGENYLIPLGLQANDREEFEQGAVAVKEIYDRLRVKKQHFALVILDACRENLLQRTSFITKPGLAKPQNNIYPPGSITWYAAATDMNAEKEHDRQHSPYTKAILTWLGEPGLSVQDMYVRVTDLVHNVYTSKGQTPWTSSSQMATYWFRETANLDARIPDFDDDVIVAVSGEVYDRRVDGPSRRLRLQPGQNILTVIVTNFNSKRGGVTPEGWRYVLFLEAVGGTARLNLFGCEPNGAPPPRVRFGNAFIAARAIVHVGETSGTITFGDVEPSVWRDGFTLLGRDDAGRTDASVRWALLRGGVSLYDRGGAGERKALSVLRQAFRHAHTKPHEEDVRCEPVGAHAAHDAAAELLARVPDDQLEAALIRVLHAELVDRKTDFVENLRWALFDDTNMAQASTKAIAARNHKMLRDLYWLRQEESPEVRDLLHLVSDDELLRLAHDLRPTSS